MSDSIQDRVFAFVEQKTCVRRERLTAETTLSKDIGLDGCPAIEFFAEFGNEFAVDLDALKPQWDSYFVSEGMPTRIGFLIAIPSLFFGVLLVHFFPQLPTWFWYSLAFGVWLAFVYCLTTWKHKGKIPQVAIQDLIDSAELGKWSKEPPARITSGLVSSGHDVGLFQR